MNKNILIWLLIITLLLSGCVDYNSETQSTPASTTNPGQTSLSVEIISFAFIPETINISKGQTVTWTQLDIAPHNIKSVNSTFSESPSLSKGQTYSYTFKETGTFEYYCSIHPSMKGKVIVK